MACSLRCVSYFPVFNETMSGSSSNNVSCFCTSLSSSECKNSISIKFPFSGIDFWGKPFIILDQKGSRNCSSKPGNRFSIQAQTACVSKAMRWWEKNLKPNMMKIQSAEQLVDTLTNAGERLVIIDFFSPGCGGCKSLHPKICQLAEQHPNAIFLEVNYEELNNMCKCLNVHVLPFFRFYKGAEGRLCSFSCTNATIKKFKDALAKHGAENCNLGPAKGLNESELMKLVSAGELPSNYIITSTKEERVQDLLIRSIELSGILNKPEIDNTELKQEVALQ